ALPALARKQKVRNRYAPRPNCHSRDLSRPPAGCSATEGSLDRGQLLSRVAGSGMAGLPCDPLLLLSRSQDHCLRPREPDQLPGPYLQPGATSDVRPAIGSPTTATAVARRSALAGRPYQSCLPELQAWRAPFLCLVPLWLAPSPARRSPLLCRNAGQLPGPLSRKPNLYPAPADRRADRLGQDQPLLSCDQRERSEGAGAAAGD